MACYEARISPAAARACRAGLAGPVGPGQAAFAAAAAEGGLHLRRRAGLHPLEDRAAHGGQRRGAAAPAPAPDPGALRAVLETVPQGRFPMTACGGRGGMRRKSAGRGAGPAVSPRYPVLLMKARIARSCSGRRAFRRMPMPAGSLRRISPFRISGLSAAGQAGS
ncbi:MAG: hypothetical protein MZV70_67250 [Desulfobacterales bacterium]|nr:hypothetical protein [Desulfobacterales bacterium]